jgi:hypothetical protein
MWKNAVQKFTDKYKFRSPASKDDIVGIENSLHVAFPEELKELLQESNGVVGGYGIELIWSTDQIDKMNVEYRRNPNFKELYMSLDELLFFGEAGNGDLFAFIVLAGAVRRQDIFMWNHETDSRVWVAPSLEKYLEWHIKGSILK